MAQWNTLRNLRTRCAARFDQPQLSPDSENYIQIAEWNTLINEAGSHLHNWIISTGEDYIWKRHTFNLVVNQMVYSLPADFFKDRYVYSTFTIPQGVPNPQAYTTYRPVRRAMPGEFRGGQTNFWYGQPTPVLSYLIMGQTVILQPCPTSLNYGLEMWYVPHYKPLVNDDDIMDISVAPGWDEFVINQVVINARIKEESDTSQLEAAQDRIKDMILTDMINRDMGKPQHVVQYDGKQEGWGDWGLGVYGFSP